MHLSTSTTFTTLLAAAGAFAISSTYSTPLPEGDIRWIGPIEQGGKNITLIGKHHEITAQLEQLNPYWLHNASATYDFNLTHPNSLEKRGRVSYQCFQGQYQPVTNLQNIEVGIRYIWAHYGSSTCGVAPRSCGRFSCSYNSAILMCNSGNNWAETPCTTLGNNANFIYNTCQDPHSGHVQGQAFYQNPTYNVLIKQTDPGNGC